MLRPGLLNLGLALQKQDLWDLLKASLSCQGTSGFKGQWRPRDLGGRRAKPTCHLVAGAGTSSSRNSGPGDKGSDLIWWLILSYYLILIFKICLFYCFILCHLSSTRQTPYPSSDPFESFGVWVKFGPTRPVRGRVSARPSSGLTPRTASLPWEMQIHLYDQHGFLLLGLKMEPFGKLTK